MHALFEKRTSNFAMRFGRCRYRDGIDLIQQIAPIRKQLDVVSRSDGTAVLLARIAYANKFDTPDGSHFSIIARVMTAEASNADGRDSQLFNFGHNLITSRFSAILYIFRQDARNYNEQRKCVHGPA